MSFVTVQWKEESKSTAARSLHVARAMSRGTRFYSYILRPKAGPIRAGESWARADDGRFAGSLAGPNVTVDASNRGSYTGRGTNATMFT